MRFRQVVRCAPLLAMALVGLGCSSSFSAPAASPAATTNSGASQGVTGVTGDSGTTPAESADTVTVMADGKVVCVVPYHGGKSVSCKVSTTQFAPGTLRISAAYVGARGSKPELSPTGGVKLLKAPTKTTLTLSAATVKYGAEQGELITVRVAPEYAGVAPGTATIRAGGTVVCTITLSPGTGSCKLTAGQLAAGSYHLTAGYSGAADFNPSASASQPLVVSK